MVRSTFTRLDLYDLVADTDFKRKCNEYTWSMLYFAVNTVNDASTEAIYISICNYKALLYGIHEET